MRLGTRIFLCYVAIFAVCFCYPVKWTLDNLRIRYLEGMEDSLVDQANILAGIIGREMEAGSFNYKSLGAVFQGMKKRSLSARIYSVTKKGIDMQVYVTDDKGRVVFDSEDPSRVGQDYSRWRDVRLTLNGEYGARSTRTDAKNVSTAVLYVAAPIIVKGKTAGVLTVAKPTTVINSLLDVAMNRSITIFGIAAISAVLLSFLMSRLMTRSITRLTRYANDVREGKKAAFPELDKSEIGEMGHAFENMKEAIEGRQYVERYVETLTHEIKSPLSAIRGAAELLEEDMSPDQRRRFLTNIRNEANRIQNLIDRLLELSALENKKALGERSSVDSRELYETVAEGMHPLLSRKQVTIQLDAPEGVTITGDVFLLQRAISNLLHNAIDFSPVGGHIVMRIATQDGMVRFTIRDNGPGIPGYARERIFDRFFSLQRPDTGKKSTGLGLNFVREVALLHGGDVIIENHPDGGAVATLVIALQ